MGHKRHRQRCLPGGPASWNAGPPWRGIVESAPRTAVVCDKSRCAAILHCFGSGAGFHTRVATLVTQQPVAGASCKGRRIELGYFIDWCEERSITRPDEVTRALLERYRQHVFHYRRKDNGTPLTQHKRLISVRMLFQWLARQYHLLFNPASELELPRTEQRLRRHVLNVAEVEQVFPPLRGDPLMELIKPCRQVWEAALARGLRALRLRTTREELEPSPGGSPRLIHSPRKGACSRMYWATLRPCCIPTVQERRKWIPTSMRE
jgi:hypothetical protein